MIAAVRLPEHCEERCPACGAVFAPSLGVRRKKVQCPKCREIVMLKSPAPAAPTIPVALVAGESAPPATAELVELRALVSRLETLPGRVELLEKQLEWLMDHRPAAEASLLRPGQRLRWLRSAPVPWTGEGEPLAGVQGEILLHNARALRSAALTIVVTAADAQARRLAERIKDLFCQAAWLVEGVHEKLLAPNQRGLVLLTSVCPPPPGFVAASMSLTAAACPIFCGYDTTVREHEIVLTVGACAPR
jgi:phage FluMu protein Com